MGTAGTEICGAGKGFRGRRAAGGGGLQRDQALGQLLVCWMAGGDPLTDCQRDVEGFKRAVCWKQRAAVAIGLADDARPVGHVVEDFADLRFHHRALFLDDHDQVEAARKAADRCGMKRPDERDLEERNTKPFGAGLVYAQFFERLPGVGIALTRGDDPDARHGAQSCQGRAQKRKRQTSSGAELGATYPDSQLGDGGADHVCPGAMDYETGGCFFF